MFLGRIAIESASHILAGGAGAEKMGTASDEISPFSNSQFLISPKGKVTERYDKIRLVPFNEYLPLRGTFTWPRWITSLERDFRPGERFTIFRVSGTRFGSPICWENLFPDLFRRFVQEGANLMISVTNEGFMGRTPGPYQSLASNVFRAVENRVSIVRVSTTGVSAFIEPTGRIAESLVDESGDELFVAGTLTRDIQLSGDGTFYTHHGDIFALAASATGLFSLFVSFIPRTRKKAG
jgi:apolipoprotein N-acyltransferase